MLPQLVKWVEQGEASVLARATLAGDDFARFVQADLAGWKEVARTANIDGSTVGAAHCIEVRDPGRTADTKGLLAQASEPQVNEAAPARSKPPSATPPLRPRTQGPLPPSHSSASPG